MQRLRSLRLEKKQTQQDIADVLGVDRTTYAKYESGANEPSIAILKQLAAHFGVTIDYLLGTSDSREAPVPLASFGVSPSLPLASLTESEREELTDFAHYLLSKRKKKDPAP